MRIIAKRTLQEFWERHRAAKEPLQRWYRTVSKQDIIWRTPADVKQKYASASIVAGNRVVFNIKGNDYRLVVKINYEYGIVYVRFIGTHAEYDDVDATDV